jgi:hypothetical protein
MSMADTKNERDRQWANFRARLDAPPKRPVKPNLILRILNSPFTIWLLSAIVITVGGSYVTGYQRCEADAGHLITTYYKDQVELTRRFQYIQSKVSAAQSFEEIELAFETHPFVYDDLKNRKTRDLDSELRRAEQLIDFSRASHSAMSARGDFIGIGADGTPFRFSPDDLSRYGSFLIGESPDSMNGIDFDTTKRFVDAFTRTNLRRLQLWNQLVLFPKCNFANSFFGVPPRGPRKVAEVAVWRL